MKKLYEADYDTIKLLTSTDLTPADICKVTGFSTATIGRIRRSGSFEGYQVMIRRYGAPTVVPHIVTESLSETPETETELDVLRDIRTILQEVSSTYANLALEYKSINLNRE